MTSIYSQVWRRRHELPDRLRARPNRSRCRAATKLHVCSCSGWGSVISVLTVAELEEHPGALSKEAKR